MKIKQQIRIVVLTVLVPFSGIQLASAAVVDWTSPEGISRLETSQYKKDFFRLANQFESQHNKVYCGVASATIVLNALRVHKNSTDIPLDDSLIDEGDLEFFPDEDGFTPFYARYTQNTVVEKSPKHRLAVMGKPAYDGADPEYGYHLDELEDLLQAHDLRTRTVHVESEDNMPQMKLELIRALETPHQYVIINYAREVVGQKPGGHISPLGAYHKDSDSFLIMDVTPTKANWIWVTSRQLFNAMATKDQPRQTGDVTESGDSLFRGYVIVDDALSKVTGKVSADSLKELRFFETIEVHTDAAGQNTCQNIRKYFPETRRQLVDLVQAVDQVGRKLILTGSGHSMAGQVACHEDAAPGEYILVTLSKMPVQHELDGRYINISAHATWKDMIEILRANDSLGPGLAPGIMQNYGVFTIGGTLSVNAMGRDPNFGPVIDSVQSFTLLKADGEVIECSRQRNNDCFEAVIGGYGLFGVILDARVMLVPDVEIQSVRMRLNNDDYADHLRKNVVGARQLDKHFGLVEIESGHVFVNVQEYYKVEDEEGAYWTEDLKPDEQLPVIPAHTTRREYLYNNRLSPGWGELNRSSQLLSVAVPLQEYETFSNGIPQLVTSFPSLKFHEITTKFIPDQNSPNMLQLITRDSIVFVFNVQNHRIDQPILEQFKSRLYKLTRRTGGKPYLAFDIPRDTGWLQEVYPRAEEWLARKNEYDPNQTFYSKFFHNFQVKMWATSIKQ